MASRGSLVEGSPCRGDSFVCGGPKSQSVVNLSWSEGSRRPRV